MIRTKKQQKSETGKAAPANSETKYDQKGHDNTAPEEQKISTEVIDSEREPKEDILDNEPYKSLYYLPPNYSYGCLDKKWSL